MPRERIPRIQQKILDLNRENSSLIKTKMKDFIKNNKMKPKHYNSTHPIDMRANHVIWEEIRRTNPKANVTKEEITNLLARKGRILRAHSSPSIHNLGFDRGCITIQCNCNKIFNVLISTYIGTKNDDSCPVCNRRKKPTSNEPKRIRSSNETTIKYTGGIKLRKGPDVITKLRELSKQYGFKEITCVSCQKTTWYDKETNTQKPIYHVMQIDHVSGRKGEGSISQYNLRPLCVNCHRKTLTVYKGWTNTDFIEPFYKPKFEGDYDRNIGTRNMIPDLNFIIQHGNPSLIDKLKEVGILEINEQLTRRVPIERLFICNQKQKQESNLTGYLLKKLNRQPICADCGLTEWLGIDIRFFLQTFHNDGVVFNNLASNLTLLCPNCVAGRQYFNPNIPFKMKDQDLLQCELIKDDLNKFYIKQQELLSNIRGTNVNELINTSTNVSELRNTNTNGSALTDTNTDIKNEVDSESENE